MAMNDFPKADISGLGQTWGSAQARVSCEMDQSGATTAFSGFFAGPEQAATGDMGGPELDGFNL